MPRARLISPEFWTSEAVVDCAPMTRLLLLGLSTFADDFGVLPLRPRTLRLQVFPGDAIDDDQMRAMIEELAARGLVRRYTVDGVEYLSILDWALDQRIGKRARRRYPAEAGRAAATTAPDHSKPWQGAASAPAQQAAPPPAAVADGPPSHAAAAAAPPADASWHHAIDAPPPVEVARRADRRRQEGRDLTLAEALAASLGRTLPPAPARGAHAVA